MSFTSIQYFFGTIALPVSNKIEKDFQNDYIDVFEEEYLVASLGRDLYKDMIAGLLEETPDAKWIALRDGKEYQVTDNGRSMTVKFEGLKNATKKITPIAHYIYIKYVERNFHQLTALGNSSSDKENARDVSIRDKMIKAYAECEKMTGKELPMSDSYLRVLYPEDIDESILDSLNPSLINFLYYNRADYPNWVFLYPDIYGVNILDL